MRIDMALQFAGAACLIETGRFASGSLVETNAQMQGLAEWIELGCERGKSGFAIGDGSDGDALRRQLSAKSQC